MSVAAVADGPRETLELVHHHPGRLRLRAELLRSPEAASRAQAALLAEPGVTGFSHRPRTGSVLVEYQPGLVDADVIIRRVAAAAGLDPPPDDPEARAPRREPAIVAVEAVREVNEIVYELTGFRADMRTLVPAGLTALAVYSFAYKKEGRLPRWDNLLYWSYNIFSQLHRREIEGSGAPRKPLP